MRRDCLANASMAMQTNQATDSKQFGICWTTNKTTKHNPPEYITRRLNFGVWFVRLCEWYYEVSSLLDVTFRHQHWSLAVTWNGHILFGTNQFLFGTAWQPSVSSIMRILKKVICRFAVYWARMFTWPDLSLDSGEHSKSGGLRLSFYAGALIWPDLFDTGVHALLERVCS